MKTIIVPTDFSPAALNATNYAADMALQLNAALLLLHVYQVPVAMNNDTPMILVSADELQEAADIKLDGLKKDLTHITSGKLEISSQARLGDVVEELEEICGRVQPLAVIMGTTGQSAVEKSLFGSTTLTAIRHLTWPVISVPSGKEYGSGIHKVGLACDFKEVLETTPFGVLRSFIHEFGAEFHVLNVNHEHRQPSADIAQQTELLQAALLDLNPRYHFIEHKDIEDGINTFAEENNLDLIIAIPKKHKLLEGLFRKSSTKQLLFQSHIPVMCVHE